MSIRIQLNLVIEKWAMPVRMKKGIDQKTSLRNKRLGFRRIIDLSVTVQYANPPSGKLLSALFTINDSHLTS
jgi:hypothetical protein